MFQEEVPGKQNYGKNLNKMPVHSGFKCQCIGFKTNAGMDFMYAAMF